MSGRMTSVVAGVLLVSLVVLGGAASAGKKGRNVVVNDPVDKNGKLYENKTYAQCDVTTVKATVKRGRLVIKMDFRGKKESGSLVVHLNTRGGKKSLPEYDIDNSGGLTKFKGPVKPEGYRDSTYKSEVAKVKLKNKMKSVQFELPLRKIGKPKNTGFQVQTCGEGATDIAPGGNYFNAGKKWDGTINRKYKDIKTGS